MEEEPEQEVMAEEEEEEEDLGPSIEELIERAQHEQVGAQHRQPCPACVDGTQSIVLCTNLWGNILHPRVWRLWLACTHRPHGNKQEG